MSQDATSASYALSKRERLYLELMGAAIKGSLGFDPLHAEAGENGHVVINPKDDYWAMYEMTELVPALQHLEYHCLIDVSLSHEGFRLEMPKVRRDQEVDE